MSITLKTHKLLWGNSGGFCAFPGCAKRLFVDATQTDDESVVGEECHIVGREPGSARYADPMTAEDRDKYANLILLCSVHHKVIDDQEVEYTKEKVRAMKSNHERAVRVTKSPADLELERDILVYADVIGQWERLCHVEHWQAWLSHLVCSPMKSIENRLSDELWAANKWLLAVVWPKRFPALEGSFRNFRRVLNDLLLTHQTRAYHPTSESESWIFRKFYQIDDWNEERYKQLGDRYDFEVALLDDLALELTRAANLICDQVRRYVDFSYRRVSGALLFTDGPTIARGGVMTSEYVPQYLEADLAREPVYPGLPSFLVLRSDRDRYFGAGTDEHDAKWKELEERRKAKGL